MARRLRHREGDESEVDLTPMLDVVFIMLIFFIVTASFVKEKGVDVDRPDASQQQSKKKSESIIVEVTAQDEVRIGPRRIDIRAVRANIERLLAESPKSGVVLKVDQDASNGAFVRVLDQAKQANAPSVALVQPVE